MKTTPEPARRVSRMVVWLGLLLVPASLGFAGLALHTNAEGTTTASNGGSGGDRRAVAIAYVDVKDGVTKLYTLKPGRVAEVWAREGMDFAKGAKLFRMEDTLEQKQLLEAQVDLQAAQQKVVQARVLAAQHIKNLAAHRAAIVVLQRDAEAAQLQHKKAKRLWEQRLGGSKEDVEAAAKLQEKAKAAVRAARARLAALEAAKPEVGIELAELDVQYKKAQLDKAKYSLQQCTVAAPAQGTVLRSMITVGDVLGPNPQQPAVIFCPDEPRIVRAEVEQEFAGRVSVGQKARIQDDATGGGEWRGTVTRISDWYSHRRSQLFEPLQFNDVRTLEVIIALEGKSKQPLRIGQRVRVLLNGADEK
jgi:multidrug resistance efflux pump